MDQNDVQPTLVIDFGDGVSGTFKAHATANQRKLVKYIKAFEEGGFAYLNAVTELVFDQVLDEEKERLDEFLEENGRADGYSDALYEGLSNCWSGETHLPLAQSSDSSVTTSSPETEQPSTADSSSADTGQTDQEFNETFLDSSQV